jgi:hypothetical protein
MATKTKTVVVEAIVIPLFFCGGCDKTYEEDAVTDAGPLYECGGCGTIFTRSTSANDNHQCPECNKFGAKMADVSCPEGCEDELEERTGLQYEGTVYEERTED